MSSKESQFQRQSETFEQRLIAAFNGQSLKEIAKIIDENASSFWNWAKQRTDMPNKVLAKIAKHTDYCLDWILTGEGEKYKGKSGFDIESFGGRYKFQADEIEKLQDIAEKLSVNVEEVIARLVRDIFVDTGETANRNDIELMRLMSSKPKAEDKDVAIIMELLKKEKVLDLIAEKLILNEKVLSTLSKIVGAEVAKTRGRPTFLLEVGNKQEEKEKAG